MSLSLHAIHVSNIGSSPLVLSDRLLSLAEDAAHAGCLHTAEHLLELAHTVFDETGHCPASAHQ